MTHGPDLAIVGMAASAVAHGAFGVVLFAAAPEIERAHTETVSIEFRNVQMETEAQVEAEAVPEPEPPEPTPLPPVLRKTHRPEPEARLAEESVVERPPLDPPRGAEEPPPEMLTPQVEPETSDVPAFGVTMESVVESNPGLQAPVGGTRTGAIGGRREPTKRPAVAPGTAGGGTATREHERILPVLTKRVVPEYTARARRAGIEGRVHLRIAVDRDGSVSDARVVSGLGHGLDESAVQAARRLRFRPGTVDGAPTRMEIPFSFAFFLEE